MGRDFSTQVRRLIVSLFLFLLQEYLDHLDSFDHHDGLKRLKYNLTVKLGKLRGQQRREQKEIEGEIGAAKLQDETSYCKKCKLAFRQTVGEHEDSELHKVS